MHASFEPAIGVRLVVYIQILKCRMRAQPGRRDLVSNGSKGNGADIQRMDLCTSPSLRWRLGVDAQSR